MRQTNKKQYASPVTELCEFYSQPLMINIGSGETIPEDSDANVNFFDEEENSGSRTTNVWDDL